MTYAESLGNVRFTMDFVNVRSYSAISGSFPVHTNLCRPVMKIVNSGGYHRDRKSCREGGKKFGFETRPTVAQK
jgi:hypothetical protein